MEVIEFLREKNLLQFFSDVIRKNQNYLRALDVANVFEDFIKKLERNEDEEEKKDNSNLSKIMLKILLVNIV